jgi:exodeoxyribonuclease V gamma subunit
MSHSVTLNDYFLKNRSDAGNFHLRMISSGMIRIYKSNNLNRLSSSLSKNLDDYPMEDPFLSPVIVVPNLDTARWLKLRLAEERGFAGNIRFMLPAEWQWNQIRRLFPELPGKLPSDPEPMKWTLFEILQDLSILNRFPHLKLFINSQPEQMREQAILQISNQISSVFDQYLVYRPEMILRWQSGNRGKGDEKWQADLWNILNKKWNNLHSNDLELNRAELFNKFLNAVRNNELQEGTEPVRFFNTGLIARPIVELMEQIGRSSDLFIYLVLPAPEKGADDHQLINAFGDESKAVSQLYDIPGSEIHEEFVLPDATDDLTAVRKSIVTQNGEFKLKPEGSRIAGIEIHSCHSRLREIETLHNVLLRLFESDETLHPDDVLVVTPDPDAYRSEVHAVFGSQEEGLPAIPYHIGSGVRPGEYSMVRSFLQLLSLPDSRFTFSGVMDFFMMKSVREHFQLSETEAHEVKRWMEENYVVWGLDSSHRTHWEQPPETIQTWQAALKRGWLGQWMASDVGEVVHDVLLYSEIKTVSDQRIWAGFSRFLYQLEKAANYVKQTRSCDEWCEWIHSLINDFFTEEAVRSPEGQLIYRKTEQLRESFALAKLNADLSYSIIRNEIKSTLEKKKSTGAIFTRGVTFSSMVPVRSIPFKIIALIGINEAVFPRKSSAPDFDLMVQNPGPVDRNRKNEDRNLFLESILAAEKVHYCSYIGQSSVDNEMIPPSPILSEWIDFLSRRSGLEADKLISSESLTLFSASGYESGLNYSRIGYETAKNILNPEAVYSGLNFNGSLPEPEYSDLITLNELIGFYSNSVKSFLKNRFEIKLGGIEEKKNEFQMNHLDRHLLFERVFEWNLEGKSDEHLQSVLIQSGLLPAGWAGKRDFLHIKKSVLDSMEIIKQHSFRPVFDKREISLSLGPYTLEGGILSYSDNMFVDINYSSYSGKILLQSWIKHLAVAASDSHLKSDSFLICEPKKGDPKLIRFKPPENPVQDLTELIKLFRDGLKTPHFFFPKTLYEYERLNINDPEKAYIKAKESFEGNDSNYSYPERDELSTLLLMGEDAPFSEEFLSERNREIIKVMIRHMEELK